MKTKIFSVILIFLILAFSYNLQGQVLSAGRSGIGLNIGGAKIYGGYRDVNNNNRPVKSGVGGLLEAYYRYTLNPRFFIVGALGYSELSDGTLVFDKCSFSTDVVNLDFKIGANLLTEGKYIPYGYFGLGAIWFHHGTGAAAARLPGNYLGGYFDPAYFLGGGVETQVSPNLGLNASADYRFTTSDDLDPEHYPDSANDGYLTFRTGLTYYMEPTRFGTGGDIEVSERTPIEELESSAFGTGEQSAADEELSALIEGIDSYEAKSESDFAMNEYIELKSRVDELNDAIGQKELEIEELKSQLSFRKERIAELESNLATGSGALASSLNVDLEDFTRSYEQALQNFYSREYDAAIYLFNMLLETYPNHKLSSNCQYWIGECYFGRGDHASAAEAFESVLNFPQTHKKDDALLMLGRCYIKLGDKQLAGQMFDQLITDYPESEYVGKAQQYANSI